uniref:Uncharacterized protein n=1 Tax=uncultured marine virus TaxID=186617 RepID=A0A0F7LB68_9VIRU|nr:hypothetical protein [uncultured marine virus]
MVDLSLVMEMAKLLLKILFLNMLVLKNGKKVGTRKKETYRYFISQKVLVKI